jgi:hypothetical protein
MPFVVMTSLRCSERIPHASCFFRNARRSDQLRLLKVVSRSSFIIALFSEGPCRAMQKRACTRSRDLHNFRGAI